MALFMSEKQKDVSVRPMKKVFSQATGLQTGLERRVFAEFHKGGIPEWAMELAVDRFPMNGKPLDLPARMYLCAYDSEVAQQEHQWSDEERAMIEAKLRAQADVIEILPPQTETPWPNYDKIVVHGRRKIEHVVEKVLEGIETTGVSKDQVLAYERQNLNREEVLAAVEAHDKVSEPEEELVEA